MGIPRNSAQLLYTVVILSLSVFILFRFANLSWVAIALDYPIQSREAAEVIATKTILSGESPSLPGNFPNKTNGYVMLNHVVSSWFLSQDAQYGDIVRVMRTSFWLASFLAVALLVTTFSKDKVPLSIILPLAVTYLVHITCLRTAMGSKPDGLGNILCLTGLLIPHFSGFSTRSLLLSVPLLVLAVFSKTIFVFGPILLLSYCFFFHGKTRGIVFAGYTALVFGSSAALYELYLPNSMGIFIEGSTIYGTGWWLACREKVPLFCKYFFPLIVFMSLSFAYSFRSYSHLRNTLYNHKVSISYPMYCFFCSVFLYYIVLIGKTTQSHYYYNYMVLFFFLWAVANTYVHVRSLSQRSGAGPLKSFWGGKRSAVVVLFIAHVLVLGNAAMAYATMYRNMESKIFSDHTAQWNELRRILTPHRNVYSHRMLASILIEQDKGYIDSGHLPYVLSVATPRNREYLEGLLESYYETIDDRLISGFYDAVFILHSILERDLRDNDIVESLDLNSMGYIVTYDQVLQSAMHKYRIIGWEKGKSP